MKEKKIESETTTIHRVTFLREATRRTEQLSPRTRLRNHRFFSLAELNRAIGKLITDLNQRPFRKLEGNRREWFERLDQPALRALPARRYEIATFQKCRVNILCGEAISVALALMSCFRRRSSQSEGHRNPVTVSVGIAAGRIPFGAAVPRRMAAVAPRHATSSPGRSVRKCWWC